MYLREIKKPLTTPPTEFEGVGIQDFEILERLYGIALSVYHFDYVPESKLFPKKLKPTVIRLSQKTKPENGTVNILRHGTHAIWVSDIVGCLGDILCPSCNNRIDGSNRHFSRHLNRCSKQKLKGGGPREVYPKCQEYKAFYGTIEQLLDEYNLNMPKEDAFFDAMCTFDCETLSVRYPEQISKGKNTKILSTLYPFVVGVCNNIEPDHPCRFFWSREVGDLRFVHDFVEHLQDLSMKAAKIADSKFGFIRTHIQKCLQASILSKNVYGMRVHKQNIERLERFMYQLPCLTFNGNETIQGNPKTEFFFCLGSSFDCKVLREFLLPILFDKYGVDNVHGECQNI